MEARGYQGGEGERNTELVWTGKDTGAILLIIVLAVLLFS